MPSSKLFEESLHLIPGDKSGYPATEITVGCEFEFLLFFHKDAISKNVFGESEAPNVHCKRVVREALKSPLQSNCSSCKAVESFNLRLNEDGYYDHSKWQVDDESALGDDPDLQLLGNKSADYGCAGIELKSRILGKAPGHRRKCCEQGKKRGLSIAEEITAVLARLNSRFREFEKVSTPRKHFAYTHYNTGFHVHIGNGNTSFEFDTIQRLLALHAACEQQIDHVHAVNRIDGLDFSGGEALSQASLLRRMDNNVYNRPLSMLFQHEAIRKRRRDHPKPDVGEDYMREGYEVDATKVQPVPKENHDFSLWMARRMQDIDSWIFRIRCENKLADLLELHKWPNKNPRTCVLNLSNLKINPGDLKYDTIEFRQHRGSLRVPEVLNYINFLVRMVVFCDQTPDSDFYSLIDQNGRFRWPEFDFVQLCKWIGCSESTQDYFNRQLDEEHDYFSEELNKELAVVNSIKGDPLASLCVHALEQERLCKRPREVKKRIARKFISGGYGRFIQAYIQASPLLFYQEVDFDAVLNRLRIDVVAPLDDECGDDHFSGDSNPQLDFDRRKLPRYIKRALGEKAKGTYEPVPPEGNDNITVQPRENRHYTMDSGAASLLSAVESPPTEPIPKPSRAVSETSRQSDTESYDGAQRPTSKSRKHPSKSGSTSSSGSENPPAKRPKGTSSTQGYESSASLSAGDSELSHPLPELRIRRGKAPVYNSGDDGSAKNGSASDELPLRPAPGARSIGRKKHS